MNDSAMYTGVDGEPGQGIFGNEDLDERTSKLLSEQKKLNQELTPKLQAILDMIENERKDVIEAIADFVDNSVNNEEVDRSEIKAAARYRKYLDALKAKYTLALRETKK